MPHDIARLFPLLVAACAGASPHVTPVASTPDDPWLRQVIYLVVTDRFTNGDPANDGLGQPDCLDPHAPSLFHGGDLAGLRSRIGYMKDLGVTALWPTPLPAQVPRRADACGYHGYWADLVDPDDRALEPKLGTWTDVEALTGALHAAGMKLMIDMVVNHSGRGARIVTQRPDWFHSDAAPEALADPDVFKSLHGLPDFAQENPEVAAYLTGMSRRWVERVKPDAIRMDTAKHVPPGYFAHDFVPAVHAAAPGIFLLAEVFDDAKIARTLPVLDAGFDSAFHFPLHRALVEALAKRGSLDAVADAMAQGIATLGPERARKLVTMIDNHDVPRFASEMPAGMGASERLARGALALTLLFTLPGIPQLYYGDELGLPGAGPENRLDMPAWAWTTADRPPDAQATFALVQRLVRVRTSAPELASGAYVELARPHGSGGNVLAFARVLGERHLLVVINGDTSARTITVEMDGPTLRDVARLSGAPTSVTPSAGAITVTMPALTAGVYAADPG
jgi:alpha-amylase